METPDSNTALGITTQPGRFAGDGIQEAGETWSAYGPVVIGNDSRPSAERQGEKYPMTLLLGNGGINDGVTWYIDGKGNVLNRVGVPTTDSPDWMGKRAPQEAIKDVIGFVSPQVLNATLEAIDIPARPVPSKIEARTQKITEILGDELSVKGFCRYGSIEIRKNDEPSSGTNAQYSIIISPDGDRGNFYFYLQSNYDFTSCPISRTGRSPLPHGLDIENQSLDISGILQTSLDTFTDIDPKDFDTFKAELSAEVEKDFTANGVAVDATW